MKKKLYYIYLVILTALVAGCQDEAMFTAEDDGLVTVSYRVKVGDDLQSRAIGDGTQVNELIVGVFQNNTQIKQYTYEVKERTAEINIPLLKTETYDLVFWAHTSGNGIYDTSDLNDITIDYSEFSKTQAEGIALDAFYTTREGVTVADPGTTSIELRRPFSQVSFGVYGNDIEKNKISSAEIIVNGTLYTGFKPLAEGEKAVEGDEETYSFEFTDLEDKTNSFIISGKEYTHLTANYFLVPTTEGTNATIGGTVRFKDENGNIVSEFTFEDAPLLANTRVNIGKGLTEVWDGVIVESLPEADEDGVIHIETTQQLAYLIKYGIAGADAENRKKLHLCKDLDMNGQVIARDKNYAVSYVEFDGGENTLYHLGTPLFDIATDIVIKDLSIDGAEPEVDSHVGVLVNTLRGNGRFENITISNSMAETENGAAGGIVGYIVRESEKERSETLDVTFTNCDLVNVEVSGSESEGKFVGLLSGYDNGETLSFDVDCSADEDTEVSDFESPYIVENQSVWLIDEDEDNNLDETYDGWLGTETYRRGVVKFDGIQLVPKWDGETTVEPFYEDNAKKVAQIWSAFDLAYLQGKSSLTTLRFKSDVDMAGVCDDCKDGNGNSTIANDDLSSCEKCKAFSPIIQLNNLYGENHTLYNLFVQGEHEADGSYNDGMGFIRHTNSGTFENFTFDGAIIKCIDDFDYRNDDQNGGNGYAGTLTSRVAAKMTINNVHAKNGHVIGISKFGGLIGYVPGGIEATGCSVDNYVIENHKINVNNSYSVSIEKSFLGIKLKAECSEDFYTEGEAGGFIGFISSDAKISNCYTSNIMMKCFGQEDRDTKILTYRQKLTGGWTRTYIDFPYTIAGRHINTFIGDIRTPSANTVVINGCTTSGIYAEGYDYNITNTGKGELVGCCYFVGKDMEVLGKSMHAGDYKGTVTIDGEEMPFVGG